MSKNCDIVKDLLPLYADDVCSEESRKLVAEHIAICGECKAELEKMGKNITISAENDIKVMKRIKKRIRIEKIVAVAFSAIMVVGLALGVLTYLINTTESVDAQKYNIQENVYVVERDGELWLGINEGASNYDFIVPTLSDSDGNHFGYGEFDSTKKNGYGFTFKRRKIDKFAIVDLPASSGFEKKLGGVDEYPYQEKIFYYDDENNKEYILWERDSND